MTGSQDISAEAARIDALYRARADAELAAADAIVSHRNAVGMWGEAPADVLLVKGSPGEQDRAGKRAFAGEDGAAITKALDALELPASRCGVCSRVGDTTRTGRVERLRLIIEAVDPRVVIALDPDAAGDCSDALGIEPLVPGRVARVLGRDVLSTDDFAASLADTAAKRRVWDQLRALGGASA